MPFDPMDSRDMDEANKGCFVAILALLLAFSIGFYLRGLL